MLMLCSSVRNLAAKKRKKDTSCPESPFLSGTLNRVINRHCQAKKINFTILLADHEPLTDKLPVQRRYPFLS